MRAALLALSLLVTIPLRASPLQERLDALARRNDKLTVGIFVERVERRASAGVNATRPFAMASTFKLPLAIATVRATETHALPPLDGKVRLLASDMLSWASPTYRRIPSGGEVSLRELLVPLLEESDNSAADALVRINGGAAKVTATLAALGLDGISIDRSEREMALDTHGIARARGRDATATRIDELLAAAPRADHEAAIAKYRVDPRDRASPSAMGRLLGKLWRGELALSPADARFVEDELARCTTGVRRLRAGLPRGTAVADRTGTCYGLDDDSPTCANDLGVVTLPSGEHVIVAVMVESAGVPLDEMEKLMADVARAVWSEYAR